MVHGMTVGELAMLFNGEHMGPKDTAIKDTATKDTPATDLETRGKINMAPGDGSDNSVHKLRGLQVHSVYSGACHNTTLYTLVTA
jgi:hypothetical protein